MTWGFDRAIFQRQSTSCFSMFADGTYFIINPYPGPWDKLLIKTLGMPNPNPAQGGGGIQLIGALNSLSDARNSLHDPKNKVLVNKMLPLGQ
jgi:hypothetical protein